MDEPPKHNDDSNEPIRKTWFGLNQRHPKLPYYFHTSSKRLRSLDEFEDAPWKGQFDPDDGKVTVAGVAQETIRWLAIFVIVGVVGGIGWLWLSGGDGCAMLPGGFKLGWC